LTLVIAEPRADHKVVRADPGSFRDRNNRVYDDGARIFRGLSATALENWQKVSRERFFQDLLREGKVVATQSVTEPELLRHPELGGWAGVVEHARIPFISYSYEWSFGMLKDAALLHLDILARALENGWTLKDSTSFNVQFQDSRPIFIDIPSFEPHVEGEPWRGYRQFCMMFLFPLMLKAYRDVDFGPFLRSDLEGIDPSLANKLISGRSRFRKGVLPHVYLHARMQERAAARELAEAKALNEDAKGRVSRSRGVKQSKTMLLATVDSLRRTIERMSTADSRTTWGDYETDHSYGDTSYESKKQFVAKHAGEKPRRLVWDIGSNTGTFSRLCEPFAEHVVSIDGDPKAIERLYQTEKRRPSSKLLPMIANLSNISPNHGWRGAERKALDSRTRPDLVLCLALIHHMVIAANVPMQEFVDWLHSLGGDLIIEFVSATDDMSQMLLRNKVNQYEDYTEERFEQLVARHFEIADSASLKGGHRKIYYLRRA